MARKLLVMVVGLVGADKAAGVGSWTLANFVAAMRLGVAADGEHLHRRSPRAPPR